MVRYVLPYKAENCGDKERKYEKVNWSEVLSLASCYMCLRGSELSLLLQSERLILVTASLVSNAVSSCDLRHERMAMDGVPKDLIL